jgi:hypothetical protein
MFSKEIEVIKRIAELIHKYFFNIEKDHSFLEDRVNQIEEALISEAVKQGIKKGTMNFRLIQYIEDVFFGYCVKLYEIWIYYAAFKKGNSYLDFLGLQGELYPSGETLEFASGEFEVIGINDLDKTIALSNPACKTPKHYLQFWVTTAIPNIGTSSIKGPGSRKKRFSNYPSDIGWKISNSLVVLPDTPIEDIAALICLYALRQGFPLNQDEINCYLIDYAKKIARTKEESKWVEDAVSAAITKFARPYYPKGLKKYLKKTIKGMVLSDFYDTSVVASTQNVSSVHEAALTIGMSRMQIYNLIKSGKVNAKKDGERTVLTQEEVDRLKEIKRLKDQRAKLTKLVSDIRKIRREAAIRWVLRRERKGKNLKEIGLELLEREKIKVLGSEQD